MRRTAITLSLVVFLIAFFISFLLSLSDNVQAADSGGNCHVETQQVPVCEEVCNGSLCGYDYYGMPLCCDRCYYEYVDECLSGYTAGQQRCDCGSIPPDPRYR